MPLFLFDNYKPFLLETEIRINYILIWEICCISKKINTTGNKGLNFVGDEDYTEYFTAWNKIGLIIFKEQENVSKRKKQGIKGNNDGAENYEIMIPFWLPVL